VSAGQRPRRIVISGGTSGIGLACAERLGAASHIPAGRVGELGEIAAVVDFLLSPGAAYMTGSIVSVDGGSSI
jgi:NAD(P)-dependent dehydrogenase (short-subunit alcohol dehydrogenase family)